MNDNIIYLTYDINFHRYLKDNGINDLAYGLHPKTKRRFWIYKRDDNFNELLLKWVSCKV